MVFLCVVILLSCVGLCAYARHPSGAYVYISLYGSAHCSKGICLVEFDIVLLCR